MTSDVFNWPPLESDPEIFTNYLVNLGLSKDFCFDEVYSLEKEDVLSLQTSTPIAVIVNYEASENQKNKDLPSEKVPFYMLQKGKLDNACGIIAALHAIGNNLSMINLKKDSTLEVFFKKSIGRNPDEISRILEDSHEFQESHKKYSSQGQSNLCNSQEEVNNHYVSFIFHNGNLIELDGVVGRPLVIEKNIKFENLLLETVNEIKKRLENKVISNNLSMLFIRNNI